MDGPGGGTSAGGGADAGGSDICVAAQADTNTHALLVLLPGRKRAWLDAILLDGVTILIYSKLKR